MIWSYILALLLSCPLHVSSHANMVWPYSWFDAGGTLGITPGMQCGAGGEILSCNWFTNFTFISGPPTLPDEMRTFQDTDGNDWTVTHPWRSPGSAPLLSPCGVGGGNPDGCPVGGPEGSCPGGGFAYGPYAEYVAFPDVRITEWQIGSLVEVGWSITANHGGGYSYRLCKVPTEGVVTEECFQQTPLEFVGEMQWVQYGQDGERVEFRANRTRTGTYPKGSQWTKNPIPACLSERGGMYENLPGCQESGPQFPPRGPGLLGYGIRPYAENKHEDTRGPIQSVDFMFTIMDVVQVPSNIPPGDYILSFRWDCEQTYQIWNTCSSIKIVP